MTCILQVAKSQTTAWQTLSAEHVLVEGVHLLPEHESAHLAKVLAEFTEKPALG